MAGPEAQGNKPAEGRSQAKTEAKAKQKKGPNPTPHRARTKPHIDGTNTSETGRLEPNSDGIAVKKQCFETNVREKF